MFPESEILNKNQIKFYKMALFFIKIILFEF